MTDLHKRIAALSPEQRELLERRMADLASARVLAPADRITPRERSGPAPTAVQQQREWTLAQFQAPNNIPGAFRVEGEIDLDLLSRVLTEVTERHEVLRSTVQQAEDGGWIQQVHPVSPVPTPVVDLTGLTEDQQRVEITRRWKAEASGPFAVDAVQRLRVSLLRLAEHVHVVLITTDHAAADLTSMAILVREFAALYALALSGAGSLPPLEIQYGDFAAWQRGIEKERTEASLAYWRESLEGVPGGLALPSDRPYPAEPRFAGSLHTVELSPALTEGARGLADAEKASLAVVLIAAGALLLHRYLEQDDVVIGEIRSGRNRAEIGPLLGCFVGALPMRVRLSEEQTLREVVRQVRQTAVGAYDHEDLPFDRFFDRLGLGPEVTSASLMDMWVNMQNPSGTLEVPGLRIGAEPVETLLAMTPITLNADPAAQALRLEWNYMTELFDAETIEVLAEQYRRILEQLVAAPDTAVGGLELRAAPQGSDTVSDAAAAAGPSFLESFHRRVALTPYAPAVFWNAVPTSYAELDRDADRLARRLRARGVGPESRVAILLDRSPLLTAAVLGVLKAGAAFVPVDPGYPAERISFLLTDAGVQALVTQESLADAAPSGYETLVLDGDAAEDTRTVDGPLELPDPATPAYVVYTSGSTGRPKGAVIEHHSLSVFARDVAGRLGLGAGDRFLQFASPSFDVLIEELFPIWSVGGSVVIPKRPLLGAGDDLAELIAHERLTVIELPTAYWHEWVRELDRLGRVLPESLRLVIIGGERVLPERLADWRRLGVPLEHCYGLTETTVTSTFFRLDPQDPTAEWPNLPIGTPLPSVDLRVLDRKLRPVPLGATGELYIGGGSLARGYLGRPGLTAQRFIADPARPGGRLYRTGDLVRQRPDGNLEFVSRVDTQIKIRGFRVEPTEIESALGRHPGVAQCVVAVYEPAPGDRRLAAYVVPAEGAGAEIAELRGHLERELPAYMVPTVFVELEELPLNANGKVDRDRLPAPDGQRPASAEEYAEPRTEVQRRLAAVVAEVVGVDRVGLHDNFFEIGGDSILAIQTVARAQEIGLRLTPFDLFAHPTVAGLAEVAEAGPVVDADQGDVVGPVPLAGAQLELCAAGIVDAQHANISVLIELPAPVAPELFGEAVDRLLGHHDGLRQRFLLGGAQTRVRIAQRGDATPFAAHDLSGLDPDAQDRRIAELCEEAQTGLNLAVGPLLRFAYFQLGGTRPDRLALVVHKLVADDASLRLILADLRTLLVARGEGREPRLPAKTTSWQAWVRRITAYGATDAVQREREHWTSLVSAPTGALPTDFPAEPEADTVETERTVLVSLDAAETEELAGSTATALTCQLDELLLIALGRTLTDWTGADRHLVDVERPGRDKLFEDVDVSRTVGRFAATHPIALTCEPGSPAESSVKRVKEELRAVPADGFGWQLLRRDREPVPASPAAVHFTFAAAPAPAKANGADSGFTVLADPAGTDLGPHAPRRHAISLRTALVDGVLELHWSYSESTHLPETVRRLAERHLGELRALLELGRGAGAVSTPSDFPLARVDQGQLDDLISRL